MAAERPISRPRRRRKGSPWHLLRNAALRLHRDDRGVVSVLVILMVWCLVSMVGMLYNNLEQTRRKSELQTAADSAAHGTAMWMARATNAVTAQNMAITQDGSTEAIWRAVSPTDQALQARLNDEIARARAIGSSNTIQPLINQLQQIGQDYDQTDMYLGELESGTGANYDSPQAAADARNSYRQARSAMNWVMNTYINGRPPAGGAAGAPPRPGAPGANGEGLAQIVTNWGQPANGQKISNDILAFIRNSELPIVDSFEKQTAPAIAQDIPGLIATHEAELFDNESAMVEGTPAAVAEQSARVDSITVPNPQNIDVGRAWGQFPTYYNEDITLATIPGGGTFTLTGNLNTTPVNIQDPLGAAPGPPLVAAWTLHAAPAQIDTIRARYPDQAAAQGLSTTITIDPLNPQTDDNRVWHPPVPVDATAFKLQYPNLRDTYTLNANAPQGWGHIYCAPLERYMRQRVAEDLRQINDNYMTPLDQSRGGPTWTGGTPLIQIIRQDLGMPSGGIQITDLPGAIPDDQPEPLPLIYNGKPPEGWTSRFDNVFVLPKMYAPAQASGSFQQAVSLYNQAGARFTGDVRKLRTMMLTFAAQFDYFTQSFAALTWQTQVELATDLVLRNLGAKGNFYVLATYKLQRAPAWAQADLLTNAQQAVQSQVLQIAMTTVQPTILQSLIQNNPHNAGQGILDADYLNQVLTGEYSADAAEVARQILMPAVQQISRDVAMEWLNRPWPYEITPPDFPVPPLRGLGPEDRKEYFSVLGAARQRDATAPRTILPAFFKTDSTKLLAYGQGEMYNPMEFSAAWGGADRFDQVTMINEVQFQIGTATFPEIIPVPRSWRVDTEGGWNWKARLSLSDLLQKFTDNHGDTPQDHDLLGLKDNGDPLNPELDLYMNDAGVKTPPDGDLREINLH